MFTPVMKISKCCVRIEHAGIPPTYSCSSYGSVMKKVFCVLVQLTGTLSDNVGMATLDKKHQEQRQQIMTTHFDGGRAHHFRAGLRSLMHGVVGGIASIPQQAIVGARDEGVVVRYVLLCYVRQSQRCSYLLEVLKRFLDL